MPAQDPHHVSALPSARAIEALRLLVRAYVDGDTNGSDDSWRAPARLMCEDARERAAQIEQLLVGLKRAWPAVVEEQGVPRADSARLLARLVTLCVEEFYGPLG